MKQGRSQRRRHWFWWVGAGVLALGAGVVILTWRTPSIVEHRLDQDDVRQKIAESIARRLKLKVGIEPLQWNGLHATSEGIVMIGEPPRSLTEMHAHHLEADGSAAEILQGKYRIESLSVDHVEMAFGEAAKTQLAAPLSPLPTLEPPADHPPVLKTELIKIVVPHTDVFWGKTKNGLGWVKDVATETTHHGDHYKIQGKGGTFQQHGWPKADLASCRIIYGKEELEIENSSMTIGGKSQITTKGKFEFGEHEEMKLSFGFHRCPVAPFLHGDLQAKFAGDVLRRYSNQPSFGREV